MTTRHHMCMDIEGFLKNSGKKAFNGLFKDDYGHPISGKVAKDMLRLELHKRKKFLLLAKADECPDFDPYGGRCSGHPICEEVTPPQNKSLP